MRNLVLVNLAFAIGLGFMIGTDVNNNWLWLTFIFTWCAAEGFLAKDTSIKWWQWALLLLALSSLDVAIVLLLK